MKTLLFVLVSFAASAQCSQEYMQELNEPIFTQYGNNDFMWFDCSNDTIALHLSDSYFKTVKLSSTKMKIAEDLAARYNYMFLQKGFSVLVIDMQDQKLEKQLKLNRQ